MNKLLQEAVSEFSRLPGIGPRTALRLVLHLIRQPLEKVHRFSEIIGKLADEIRYCPVCCNISDDGNCHICTDNKRDHFTVCVVENIRDVLAIEKTGQYRGVYHVLGGLISPVDGIGPADLKIEALGERIKTGQLKEIIMALNASMEAETTVFYLYRRFGTGMPISVIARGIPVGDDLEYADEITLGRSLQNRIPYEQSLAK